MIIADCHIHYGRDYLLKLYIDRNAIMRQCMKYEISHAMVFAGAAYPDEINDLNNEIMQFAKEVKEIFCLLRLTKQNTREVVRLVKQELDHKVVGIKFHPSLDKTRVTEPEFAEVFEILAQQKAITLVHCGRWQDVASWKYVIELATRYPNLRVIMGHMGGTHPELALQAIEACKKTGNVWLDTSNTRPPVLIERAVQELGSRRILYGSDLPWSVPLANIVTVTESQISVADKIAIMHDNLAEILAE